jgi:[ribosomal protein S5]-alanine N-acetyltransferase
MGMETARLVLVPCSEALLDALPDRAAAGHVVGATVPPDWPDDELAGLLGLYAGWLRDDPSVLGFGPWIAIEPDEGVVVGSAGFVGKPKGGEVELGYGIVEAHRNRGYATEAAGALVAWALAQPGIDSVIAHSEMENDSSTRVLEKLGFERDGLEGRLVRWIRR